MLKKFNLLSIEAYTKMQQLGEDLSQDNRGLSDIVVAVMLILVGVLAAGLMWTFLGDYIEDMWGTITDKSSI